MATFTEVFNECWENAAVEDIVALHNVWAYEESSDDLIYDNIDSQLDELFATPTEAVRAASFGNYKYHDSYMWFNGYANLESGTYEHDLNIDQSALCSYFEGYQSKLAGLDGFEEAADWDGDEESCCEYCGEPFEDDGDPYIDDMGRHFCCKECMFELNPGTKETWEAEENE